MGDRLPRVHIEDPVRCDRDEIRRLFQLVDEPAPDDPQAVRTNRLIDTAVEIADHWNARGRLVELLTPLLEVGEADWVRYGCASVLLNRGHEDLAVPVLESIDRPEARMLLDYWRRQQGQSGAE